MFSVLPGLKYNTAISYMSATRGATEAMEAEMKRYVAYLANVTIVAASTVEAYDFTGSFLYLWGYTALVKNEDGANYRTCYAQFIPDAGGSYTIFHATIAPGDIWKPTVFFPLPIKYTGAGDIDVTTSDNNVKLHCMFYGTPVT